MKNIFLSVIALSSVFSCQTVSNGPEVPEDGGDAFQFLAEIVSDSFESDETAFKSVWSADDELSVIVADNGKYTSHRFMQSALESDIFYAADRYVLSETAKAVYVMYPYSENMTSVDENGNVNYPVNIGSTADDPQGIESAPLCGYVGAFQKDDKYCIQMKHISSAIEVIIKNGTQDDFTVNNITVTTDAEYALTGEFFVNPGTSEVTAGSSVSPAASLYVSGTSIEPQASASFYITVAPFELESQLLTVTVNGEYVFSNTVTMTFQAGRAESVNVEILPEEKPVLTLDKSEVYYDFMTDPEPEHVKLQAISMPEGAESLTWATSDRYVVKVEDGELLPVGHGVATVTATADDKAGSIATCIVKVRGIRDLNYGREGGSYDKLYLPVNIEVTGEDGEKYVQTWLDRNLGASQVASSAEDYLSYGSHFQWSRKADGHELVNWTSGSRGTHPNIDRSKEYIAEDRSDAGTQDFIKVAKATIGQVEIGTDWAEDPDSDENGLWGGIVIGKDSFQDNNPCPAGYRVPSAEEMYLMFSKIIGIEVTGTMNNVSIENLADRLFISELHIPICGFTNESTDSDATAAGLSNEGGFWVNTPGLAERHTQARRIHFNAKNSLFSTATASRSRGYAVRCIRYEALPSVALE